MRTGTSSARDSVVENLPQLLWNSATGFLVEILVGGSLLEGLVDYSLVGGLAGYALVESLA